MESLIQFFTSGDIWAVIIKVLITALLSAGVGYLCTLIGKLVSKSKNSKIIRYAKICVEAAEQKFPNEGKKMGPEKMQYVMDQLSIKFPKIKENTYLYNIVESAVYELNREKKQEAAIKEFEQKYGEKPIAIQDQDKESTNNIIDDENKSEDTIVESAKNNIENVEKVEVKAQSVKKESSTKLNIF